MNTPLNALDRLLGEARDLARQSDWLGLARLADPMSREELLRQPELAYLVADAHHRIGGIAAALDVARSVEGRGTDGCGDPRLSLRLANLIGMCHFLQGQMEEAEQSFSFLMEAAMRKDDAEFVARAANNLGVIANVRGNPDEALTFYMRALAAYEDLGHLRGIAQTRHNLGISHRDLGLLEEADAHFRRAGELAAEAGSVDVVAFAEAERALLRVAAGDGAFAEGLARHALERLTGLGDPQKRAEGQRVLAAAVAAQGRVDEALDLLTNAAGVAVASGNPLLRAEVQRDRGLLLLPRDPTTARTVLTDAAAHFDVIHARVQAEAVRALLTRT